MIRYDDATWSKQQSVTCLVNFIRPDVLHQATVTDTCINIFMSIYSNAVQPVAPMVY